MLFECKMAFCRLYCIILSIVLMGEFSLLGVPVDSHQILKDKHLLLSATRKPLVKKPELTILSLGLLEAMVIEVLSSYLQFTYSQSAIFARFFSGLETFRSFYRYEICPPSDILSSGFRQPNGSWTGTTGQLERREVDMCVTTIPLTSAKSLVIDMSFPVVFVETGIIIPFPNEKDKWINTSAFDSQVWMVLLFIFVFMIFTNWIINRITNNLRTTENSIIYWIFYFISIWTSQGISTKNKSVAFRLALFVSVFGVYIISNYFTAAYTSVLSIPNFKTTVNSIEDLANSNTIKTLLAKGSSADDYMLVSEDPKYKKIGDQMRAHPNRRITNAFSVDDISTIVKDDFALVMIKPNAESMIETSYQRNNKKCRVTLAEQTFHSQPQGFTFPKNSSIAAMIYEGLLLLHQSGLIQYAERRSRISRNRCSISEVKNDIANKPESLKLDQMAGAFVILIAGTVLSFLTLFAELSLSKVN